VTTHIADIASYQGTLTIPQLRAAGFGGINVKVSHGATTKSVHPDVAAYVREARAAGMALSSFHWLTASPSGTAQADYAFRQMAALGLTAAGAAHVVDVEDAALVNGQAYRDYCLRMQVLLDRPIAIYTGDWFAADRAWLRASPESPWLWSAPTVGYVPAYPGDGSPMWETGYAGWPELSVMQYRVAKVAGIPVSQSAVRDADLWARMTGVAMANSQNGWPVVGQSAVTDRAIRGVEFPNGWLKGDVDVIFTYLINRLHLEVEAMITPGCWGWFIKKIVNSDEYSNHSSGTAIDYNAPNHPYGKRNTYSAADRNKIHAILDDLDGVVRWGGDYTGTPDDMHFEINKGKAAVKVVADRIRAGENSMDWADDVIANPSWRADSAVNPTVQAKFAISDSWTRAHLAEVKSAEAAAGVAALKTQLSSVSAVLLAAIRENGDVDETALAEALIPGLSAAIIAELPESALTIEGVEQAVRNVLLTGAAPDA